MSNRIIKLPVDKFFVDSKATAEQELDMNTSMDMGCTIIYALVLILIVVPIINGIITFMEALLVTISH